MTFGAAVRAAREARGLSRQAVADACGCTYENIRKVEHDLYVLRPLAADRLRELCPELVAVWPKRLPRGRPRQLAASIDGRPSEPKTRKTAHDTAIRHCQRIGMTAEEIAEDLELPIGHVVRRLVRLGLSRLGFHRGPRVDPTPIEQAWTEHHEAIIAGTLAGVAVATLSRDLGAPVDRIIKAARRGWIDAPELIAALGERAKTDLRFVEGRHGCSAVAPQAASGADEGAKID